MIDKIQKIAKDVFNELGSGHAEAVYQKAMEVGLRLEKIPYENQRIVPIYYKRYNVGQGIPDIIVNEGNNGKIVIELKAVGSKLSNKEEVQLRKYMEVLGIKKGILINFPQPDSKKTPNEPEIKIVK
ncbi:MAG: GxxExxY protein [Candidatus Woesearchaeota archaeon]|nr:MAG: GxxExxY protein [Candidatus Woesearchaeota archaeon]